MFANAGTKPGGLGGTAEDRAGLVRSEEVSVTLFRGDDKARIGVVE